HWDGYQGLGEQTSALEVINSLLVKPPLTIKTGGSNRTNYEAGAGVDHTANHNKVTEIGADKVGAAIVTILILTIPVAMAGFLVFS
ncbi:DFG5, partial [[Candida] subhashii]